MYIWPCMKPTMVSRTTAIAFAVAFTVATMLGTVGVIALTMVAVAATAVAATAIAATAIAARVVLAIVAVRRSILVTRPSFFYFSSFPCLFRCIRE